MKRPYTVGEFHALQGENEGRVSSPLLKIRGGGGGGICFLKTLGSTAGVFQIMAEKAYFGSK